MIYFFAVIILFKFYYSILLIKNSNYLGHVVDNFLGFKTLIYSLRLVNFLHCTIRIHCIVKISTLVRFQLKVILYFVIQVIIVIRKSLFSNFT